MVRAQKFSEYLCEQDNHFAPNCTQSIFHINSAPPSAPWPALSLQSAHSLLIILLRYAMASGTSWNFRRSRPLIQALFTSFPTTLHHYSPSRNLAEQSYYRSAHAFSRDHEVVVYKDGLVYPAVNGNDCMFTLY